MKNSKPTGPGQIDTLIGANTRIEGDLHFHGGLHVDGVVKGAVVADQADSHLSVSDKGTIEGEIRVPNVVIDGVLVGDIVGAERVELEPRARITGSIEYHAIQMALGAQVTGNINYRGQSADQPKAAPNVTELDSSSKSASKG